MESLNCVSEGRVCSRETPTFVFPMKRAHRNVLAFVGNTNVGVSREQTLPSKTQSETQISPLLICLLQVMMSWR
eukprot:8914632-Pyramimonas_sp.AAC.1